MLLFRSSGLIAIAFALGLAGCGTAGSASRDAGSAGLATVVDSTADSIFARVAGAVPEGAVRHLAEDFRIAPGADDTTLFTDISEFDVDRSGRFWVYDRPSNSIFLFGSDGALVRRIGRQGAGPGEFNSNNGMVALGDTGLAIWDARNARVSLLDDTGSFRTSWPTPAGFFTSNGLYTDHSGRLYLRRAVTARREGEIMGRMGLVGLVEGGRLVDSLLPPDLPVQREVYVASREGSTSSTSSEHAPGYYWAWHPDSYFVVGHGGRFEIVLARPGGKPIVIRREAPPIPVPAEERDQERARLIWQLRQTDPGWSWSGPALPEFKAPLDGLFVSRDGRIWARVAAPSEPVPDTELPVRRDSTMPIVRYRTPPVYEVFAADGRFLGRVVFPSRVTLVEADGDQVWARGLGEDDLPAVVRYRIEPGLR